jgi:prolyl-tRNA editing enzyme YbaK/EbsC (Cys-tRNA(Pro) deacylase)
MSLDSVRAFFSQHAPDIEIIVTEASSATVSEAATAHQALPEQIAKTLGVWLKNEIVLIVMSGTARLDNRKFKDRFGEKPRMVDAVEITTRTSHPVGGVCPFGLAEPLKIFADESLKRFDLVIPAAGATNAAVKIAPERLAALVNAEWIDLAKEGI